MQRVGRSLPASARSSISAAAPASDQVAGRRDVRYRHGASNRPPRPSHRCADETDTESEPQTPDTRQYDAASTEAGNNWIGYVVHHAPGPMLAVQPTVSLAKIFSQQRVAPLTEDTPAVRARVAPARSRDSGNTVLSKEFPGGILVMTGANSAVGLRSMPVRYLFLDEVDAYPASADDEGDPVALAEARTRTFTWRRKVFLVSTPTIKGLSRIERQYEASDQRRYFV
ncbi:MAG TPA: phage terminase large subunit family protein, partial [Rhodospirillales bacterium]|nr:phage terminase large subunit family protein [Rhodospirillales bacterium]